MNARTLLITSVLLAVAGCCGTTNYPVMTCNGLELPVLQNTQVFDVYATDTSLEASILAKSRGKLVELSAGGKYGSDVVKLFQDLDNNTAVLKAEMATAYGVYLADLCAARTAEERQRASAAWYAHRDRALQYASDLRQVTQKAAQAQSATSSTVQQIEQLLDVGRKAVATAQRRIESP